MEWNQDSSEVHRPDGHTISYTPLGDVGLQLTQRMTLDVSADLSQSTGHHSVSISGLSPGVTYSVQITAFNSGGKSEPSEEAISGGECDEAVCLKSSTCEG